ncbi:MAG: signal peptide peptidase SppA [Myxococcota bacterium]|nr:signal peptide peptidase SppA [Myxococcota bacterium]
MKSFSGFRCLPILLLCCLWGANVSGQPNNELVIQPYADPVAGDHAEAVIINPAGLIFGESLQLSFTHATGETDRSGHGYALMMSGRLGLSLATGLAYERMQLPGEQTSLPARWSWANAIRLGPYIGLGLTWHHLSGSQWGAFDGLNQITAGLQIRPSRWLAAGATAMNVNRPTVGDQDLPRVWRLGLALRPGTTRVQLSGLAELTEDSDALAYGIRGVWQVYGPLGLIARFDETRQSDADEKRILLGFNWNSGLDAGFAVEGAAGRLNSDSSNAVFTLRTSRPGESRPLPTSRVKFAHVIMDNTNEYQVTGFFTPEAHAPFLNLLRTLDDLASTARVQGVLLDVRSRQIGWGQASELAVRIQKLKDAGKLVYVWMPAGDTRTYAAVAGANRILITPSGGLLLTGVVGQSDHIKTGLDRLGVDAEFVTTGAYKTFPETFTKSKPSDASKEVQTQMVNTLYEDVVKKIATGRQKSTAEVKAIIDDGPYTAKRALNAGLVDRVIHYDEFESLFHKEFGKSARLMPASAFLRPTNRHWGHPDSIAAVFVTGTITDGASNQNPVFGAASSGSKTIVAALERLRTNSDIKAVVIRIDSPGGSVSASDSIWRAVQRVNQVKPVLVSMGDVAASGGYYVASAARKIYASDMSVTGSIGVFAGKVSGQTLLDRLGANRTYFLRGRHAAMLSITQPWSNSERAAIQRSMDAYYNVFLDRVSAGRKNLTRDEIKARAAGRVWMGIQAKDNGLLDGNQGFLETLRDAAELTGQPLSTLAIRIEPRPAAGWSFGSLPLARTQTDQRPNHMPLNLPPFVTDYYRSLTSSFLLFEPGTALSIVPFRFKR